MALSDEIVMFIDASRCIGCKACQVACKQWHQMPAETTAFAGSYQNPPDLSGSTLTLVKFKETTNAEWGATYQGMKWLFLKDQCRHCFRPKCARICPTGIYRSDQGFVIFTENCKPENLKLRKNMYDLADACPYDIPRYSPVLGRYVKCDFCFDRFNHSDPHINNKTACEAACPANAIVTGSFAAMNALAKTRYRAIRKTHRFAKVYGGKGAGRTNVLYLLTDPPSSYGL